MEEAWQRQDISRPTTPTLQYPETEEQIENALVAIDDDIIRDARKRKTAPPDLVPLSPTAVRREANKYYPLLTQDRAPFPFVNPAAVIPPTLQEAQQGVTYPRTTPRLPTVAVHHLSAALSKVPKIPKVTTGMRPPDYRAQAERAMEKLSELSAASAARGTGGAGGAGGTGGNGTMGPPHPAQKRKRAE